MVEHKREVYVNREFSWLKFNERVLEEAENTSNPTFERLRFLSIFKGNLEEFYQVRVSMLSDQLLLDEDWRDSQTKTDVKTQFQTVLRRTRYILPRYNTAYQAIVTDFKNYGFSKIKENDQLGSKDEAYLKNIFKFRIAPLIVPFIVEKNHPLPFFENRENIFGATLKTKNDKIRFGFSEFPKKWNAYTDSQVILSVLFY